MIDTPNTHNPTDTPPPLDGAPGALTALRHHLPRLLNEQPRTVVELQEALRADAETTNIDPTNMHRALEAIGAVVVATTSDGKAIFGPPANNKGPPYLAIRPATFERIEAALSTKPLTTDVIARRVSHHRTTVRRALVFLVERGRAVKTVRGGQHFYRRASNTSTDPPVVTATETGAREPLVSSRPPSCLPRVKAALTTRPQTMGQLAAKTGAGKTSIREALLLLRDEVVVHHDARPRLYSRLPGPPHEHEPEPEPTPASSVPTPDRVSGPSQSEPPARRNVDNQIAVVRPRNPRELARELEALYEKKSHLTRALEEVNWEVEKVILEFEGI